MTVRADPSELAGRVVLVTGAGRGLGRALVEHLVGAGVRVAGCARSRSDLESLSAALAGAPHTPRLEAADVTDADAMVEFVAETEQRWGRIDGVVCNASVLGRRGPLREVDPAEWRRVIDVNLTGAFLTCRAAIPALRRAGGGSIVNVSSGVGDRPREDWGPYAVSKWALEGFSWNLAREEQEAGIRVNVVDPGGMRTDMRAAAYPNEDPATLPDPADVTDVYLWLLDPNTAVTGQRFAARDWSPPA